MLDQLFIYQPSAWTERNWSEISGLPLEDVWIQVEQGVRIFAWYVDAGPNHPVMLWCHGNAGNISHRLENLWELYRRGVSVLLFDYRGYGKSSGEPSESGFYADALASYDHLIMRQGVRSEQLVVFGRSIGAAVAGEVAKQRGAAGLILEGAFPTIQSMADQHYFGLPAGWFVDAEFNLRGKLPSIQMPLLSIHGDRDSIVPIQLGKEVYEAARHPKAWYSVLGAGHNDVPFVGGKAYFQRMMTFIHKVVR